MREMRRPQRLAPGKAVGTVIGDQDDVHGPLCPLARGRHGTAPRDRQHRARWQGWRAAGPPPSGWAGGGGGGPGDRQPGRCISNFAVTEVYSIYPIRATGSKSSGSTRPSVTTASSTCTPTTSPITMTLL